MHESRLEQLKKQLKKQLEGQRGARAYFEQQGWESP